MAAITYDLGDGDDLSVFVAESLEGGGDLLRLTLVLLGGCDFGGLGAAQQLERVEVVEHGHASPSEDLQALFGEVTAAEDGVIQDAQGAVFESQR